MKRIKYLGVLLSIVTLCVACEKSEKDGLGGFHKNFVELYVDGQIMLTEFQNECSGDAHRLSKNRLRDLSYAYHLPKCIFLRTRHSKNSTDGLQETTILILIRY